MYLQLVHERVEHRRVTSLLGSEERYQRQTVPIDELMDFRRQTTARAADRVIRRFPARIAIIRSRPL